MMATANLVKNPLCMERASQQEHPGDTGDLEAYNFKKSKELFNSKF